MSFVKIDNNLFERSSLLLRPSISFISSSAGITGSEFVSAIRSKCIKDIVDPGVSSANQVTSRNYNELDFAVLSNIDRAATKVRDGSVTDIHRYLDLYLSAANDAPKDLRHDKLINVFRFDVPVRFNQNFNIKNNLRKTLLPYHKHRYPDLGFHYTNYNTLNFYTGSKSPKDSCLIYPNLNNVYTPTGPFTLDFWINPRYSNQTPSEHFTAGTIFHMSSSIALTLVSGSGRDANNLVNTYKLLLQLSASADTPPTKINLNNLPNTYPNNLIYTSSTDLHKNHWHHVSVAWGGVTKNNATGSINVDGNETFFHIPSSSLCQANQAIVIGNYLNTDPDNVPKFFNKDVSTDALANRPQGLTKLTESTSEPSNLNNIFNNGLNAEIHDIKLFKQFLNSDEILQMKDVGVTNRSLVGSEITNLYDELLFYVPVFFYPITRPREVLLTPFQTSDGDGSTAADTTNDPFNVQFSFGVAGKMINLENFTREFKQAEFPRLHKLTGSTINETIQNITADQYVYHTASLLRRNNLILPNDNGQFKPDYYPIAISAASSSNTYYQNGTLTDYGRVSLENLIPTSSLFDGLVFQSGSIFDDIVGSSPENPGVAPGSVLTIAQRTRDVSSNEIAIFDISNLFYGNKINPGSFSMVDTQLTGTEGRVKITLSDNKKGSLFRSDCLTKQAEWNNVGDILYEEGMAIVKSPHLFYYCKDRLEMNFKGEQNIHTMIINIPAEKGMLNSSSNPTFLSVSPTNNANDRGEESIYITAVNIHDDNFNIIMKAHFSQPLLKTENDEFVVRLKQDF